MSYLSAPVRVTYIFTHSVGKIDCNGLKRTFSGEAVFEKLLRAGDGEWVLSSLDKKLNLFNRVHRSRRIVCRRIAGAEISNPRSTV